jgi:hypothetical protein
LYLILIVAEGFASAEATKGLSDRPLETFGVDTPMLLDFYRKFLVSVPFVTPCNMKNQAAWRTKAKGSRGRPQSPLVAPAGAKSLHKHAKTA